MQNVLNDGGFIVGCYVEDTLVACAICEPPSGDYLNNLYDIGMTDDENTEDTDNTPVNPF